MLPVISFVSAAAPVAAEASNWIWDKGNQAVNRVSARSVLAHQWEIRSFVCVHCSRPAAFKNVLKCFT